MFKFIFIFLGVFFLLRFLMRIYRFVGNANDSIKQAKEQMQQMQDNHNAQNQKRETIDGEYIDYEEIK